MHTRRLDTSVLILALTCFSVESVAQPLPTCHVVNPADPSTKPAMRLTGIGESHMTVTARSPEAQAFFDQGLSLLHGFWLYEADHAFAEAARLDPSCAMAQWGIAMVALNEARRDAALAKAKALAPGASDRERIYIEAVHARYQGTKIVVQNNRFLGATEPYRHVLRRLVAMYPDDLNAKLFLALASLAGYERDGTPRAGTTEAVALCQVVLARDPRNAAANHYLIHVLESSKRPQDAIAAAEVYGSLGPNVGHVVHMPGHIYVHVNRWEEAAKAFNASAAVDREYLARDKEISDHSAGPYGHNLHFLATVRGYQGRYREGLKAAEELLQRATLPGEAESGAALEGRMAMLRLLVRFQRWDDILGKALPEAGPFEAWKAWRLYALGLARLGTGDVGGARAELARLEQELVRLKEELPKKAVLPQRVVQLRYLQPLGVTPFDLKGRILAREGKVQEAMQTLQAGLEAEREYGYSEPSLYPQPMEEVIGQVALDLHRWDDADRMFRAALERDPGSGRAHLGMSRASRGLGKLADENKAAALFRDAWAGADPDLPELKAPKKKASRP